MAYPNLVQGMDPRMFVLFDRFRPAFPRTLICIFTVTRPDITNKRLLDSRILQVLSSLVKPFLQKFLKNFSVSRRNRNLLTHRHKMPRKDTMKSCSAIKIELALSLMLTPFNSVISTIASVNRAISIMSFSDFIRHFP